MRVLAVVIFNWLHQVALAVWLGGIVTLGAVAAPAVFGAAKARGDIHPGTPLHAFAGEALGEAFRRFNAVVLIAGAVMLLTGLAYGLLAGLCRRRLFVRTTLTALAWGIGGWVTFALYPQVVEARVQGQTALFDSLHRTYTAAFHAQTLLLLTVAALTAWLHLDRPPHPAAGEAAQGEHLAGDGRTHAQPVPAPYR